MSDSREDLEARVEKLEHELQVEQNSHKAKKSVRARSHKKLLGLPLYDVAIGPDFESGEARGHAKGIFAIGDQATGVIAVGGIAQGGVAIGGLACGLLSLGGCAFGLLGVVGGVALGGFAYGGVAVGLKAIGGVAVDPGWFGDAQLPITKP
ncbi:hypothetical protein Mal52_46760 [Symmachiella dynata]|uniref:Uncharacterized protein n=1 Tax=Symmachiella dynata TaxID=2527995 RepID=A0A517ZUL7_9PLAN|nr:hypothetical protein [Symmachiella dynata]QDU46177.1 hypothetical protein Mal52_46760 [Symmachiella dynata]